MNIGLLAAESIALPLAGLGAKAALDWVSDRLRAPSTEALRPLLSKLLENKDFAEEMQRAGAIAAQAYQESQNDGWSEEEQEEFLLSCFDMLSKLGKRSLFRVLRSRNQL